MGDVKARNLTENVFRSNGEGLNLSSNPSAKIWKNGMGCSGYREILVHM